MALTIDIDIQNAPPDIDSNTIAAYIAALLQQQSGAQVTTHIIDSDYVDPIMLAEKLRLQGFERGHHQ
jgi:hypothetical protein